MAYSYRISLKLVGVLSGATLVAIFAGIAACQTPPKTTPDSKSSIPSAASQQHQAAPPPSAKTNAPPAAKSNPAIPPMPTATTPDKPDDRPTFEADKVTVDENTKISTAINFKYTEKDTVITGDKTRYNKKQEFLDAEGNLVLDDPKHHATGDKAHVDRAKRLAIITSNVVIVLKPEPEQPAANGAPNPDKNNQDSAKEKKRGGTITCDKVEDYYRRKFSILTGHLVFKQHFTNDKGEMVERTLTAEHAEYDGKSEILHLFGPVDYQDSEKRESHTKEDVIVGTKEGQETVEFKGRSVTTLPSVPPDDEDETKPPAKPEKNPGKSGNH